LLETRFSGFSGLDDRVLAVVLRFVLDGWDHPDLSHSAVGTVSSAGEEGGILVPSCEVRRTGADA